MKKLSFCGWLRRLRYPATPKGRKKYIEDNIKDYDSYRVYRLKELGYAILIGLTCAALIIILILILF